MDRILVPDRLRTIREDRKLSKAAAARLLDLSKMGYLRYETGDRVPSYQTLVFMAQKLDTSAEYLTGVTDDPGPRQLIIRREEDPELFDLVRDLKDSASARDRLLAYYHYLKSGAEGAQS